MVKEALATQSLSLIIAHIKKDFMRKNILIKHFYRNKIRFCIEFKLALDFLINPYDLRMVKEALAIKSPSLIIAWIKKRWHKYVFGPYKISKFWF